MRKLVVHNDRCVGCRICEMVCSQRHTSAFSRSGSSVYVDRIERNGSMEITIFKEKMDGKTPCDLCEDLNLPLCVKFCPEAAIAIRKA